MFAYAKGAFERVLAVITTRLRVAADVWVSELDTRTLAVQCSVRVRAQKLLAELEQLDCGVRAASILGRETRYVQGWIAGYANPDHVVYQPATKRTKPHGGQSADHLDAEDEEEEPP